MADANDVIRLAALSRVHVPEAELTAFAEGFNTIVEYIGQLDGLTLPTEGGEVLPPVHNVFRPDGTSTPAGYWTKKLVAQFPAHDGDSLSVKKIIVHD
jgi:Asp-tRNA(Asn)/Glu-tRNA(Gln) amidotransferase C subunit